MKLNIMRSRWNLQYVPLIILLFVLEIEYEGEHKKSLSSHKRQICAFGA